MKAAGGSFDRLIGPVDDTRRLDRVTAPTLGVIPMAAQSPDHPEIPPPLAYLLMLAILFPVWMVGGLIWGAFMVVTSGWTTAAAVAGGLRWGLTMWVLVGNLVAISVVWRRSGELPVPDRAAFRAAVERACDKLRLIILSESADLMILGPKRVLIRLRTQEVRLAFTGDTAVLTAPALSFGTIRKEILRALATAPAGAP